MNEPETKAEHFNFEMLLKLPRHTPDEEVGALLRGIEVRSLERIAVALERIASSIDSSRIETLEANVGVVLDLMNEHGPRVVDLAGEVKELKAEIARKAARDAATGGGSSR